ncbi:MAG TPA: DUF3769 domain-containing protein, partial [Candidatus Caenarcaniphilales bacterium]
PLGLPTNQQAAGKVEQVLTGLGNTLVASGLSARLTLGSNLSAAPDRFPKTAKTQKAAVTQLVVAQGSPPPTARPDNAAEEPIELNADRQEYNDVSQVFTAAGNVLMRFRGAVLSADELQVNLRSQIAIASGNITLTRGQQVLKGEKLTYRFVENRGGFLGASGTIYLPTAGSDFSPTLPTDVSTEAQPFSEQIRNNQPLQVRTAASIQQLRFEAEQIEFNSQGWQARNIQITSDPFSPPELVVKADQAKLTRISPIEDKVTTRRPRLVLDQGLSLPILQSQVTIDRQERDPTSTALPRIGFDENDRGGLFIGRNFEPLLGGQTNLRITPQFLLGRALETRSYNVLDPALYGLNLDLRSNLGPRSFLSGFTTFTSLDPGEIAENTRARLSLRQLVSTHTLTVEASYRDRLFNGSLGEQTVRSSLGAILSSPPIAVGNTGINLSYQVGTQYVRANTNRLGLADPASLGRFQASAALNRSFYLWQGNSLPATATGGLRYTSSPVAPYLQLLTGVTGVTNAYTNGDTQQTLIGTIGLQGQYGHFSRPFLDYTGFNISYSQVGQIGLSPFLFDRVNDFKVLSVGVLQQIYGPVRLGFRASLNLDTGNLFDSDYVLDYSRRTYGLILRYSPSRQLASFNFRLSGFNWTGDSAPLSGAEIRTVTGGIERRNE